MKILTIEDEVILAEAIQEYLNSAGHHCELALDFESAWEKIEIYRYDCILVDINLPGGSGLSIVEELKRLSPQSGIIIISAKRELEDKVNGLEIGSDDYLTKPFHLPELNARIKALGRRKQFKGNKELIIGKLRIRPDDQLVRLGEHSLELTRSEYRLLLYFVANQNRVLSKGIIAEHLVGDDADLLNSHDFVYSHVKNLRKKLMAAGGPNYLETVYGVGYKFSLL